MPRAGQPEEPVATTCSFVAIALFRLRRKEPNLIRSALLTGEKGGSVGKPIFSARTTRHIPASVIPSHKRCDRLRLAFARSFSRPHAGLRERVRRIVRHARGERLNRTVCDSLCWPTVPRCPVFTAKGGTLPGPQTEVLLGSPFGTAWPSNQASFFSQM